MRRERKAWIKAQQDLMKLQKPEGDTVAQILDRLRRELYDINGEQSIVWQHLVQQIRSCSPEAIQIIKAHKDIVLRHISTVVYEITKVVHHHCDVRESYDVDFYLRLLRHFVEAAKADYLFMFELIESADTRNSESQQAIELIQKWLSESNELSPDWQKLIEAQAEWEARECAYLKGKL